MNSLSAAPQRHRGYSGVAQIISFNRNLYVMTLFGVLASFVAATVLPKFRFLSVAAGLMVLGWVGISVAASHYIYDLSPLYRFLWIRDRISVPRAWANIHCGLDQTSEMLRTMFPEILGHILDIYEPTEMPETSIARARGSAAAVPATLRSDFRKLPLASSSCDAVFLILAAHELRRRTSRAELFQQVARVLGPNGTVVLVEHLRDLANFLAFGPGFLHFHSRREWLHAATSANLSVAAEFSITPFVRVFLLVHKHGDRNPS